MPMITSCVTVSAAPRRPLSLSSVPMERPHGPGPGPGASPQSPGHHGRQGHAAGQHAVWQHPFPTPPGKRQQDATPPGTPNKDAKDSKKKWSLGALGLGGALSGSLSGSIGGLFRRRRKSDSSSSLEEEELATPPSARKTSNGISSNNFLRRRREASTNNNNNNSKRKTRTNARVSGAFDHVVVTPLAQPLSQPYSPTKVEHVNGYLIHPNSHFAPNLHMPGLAGSPIDSGQFGGSFPKALNLQQDRHRGWVSPSSPPQHLLQPPQLHGRHRRQDSKGSSVGSGVGSGQGSAGHSGASASGASGSLDGIIRRGKRDLAKQRAELRRQAAGGDSSSEGEGSLHSNSSSLSRFRSDDSLPSNKDSLSRRSRTARTERYLRRLSKDEEGMAQAGGQAVPKWPKTLSMSANSSPVTSPASRPRNAAHLQDPRLDPANIAGLPASQSLRGAAGVVRQQANGRSVSYDCNMDNSDVMVVQFPVARMQALPLAAAGAAPAGLSRGGSVSPSRFSAFARQQPQQEPLQHQQQLQQPLVQQQGEPPPPPPRDPQRRYMTASQLDVGRPMSYAFETGSRHSLTNNQQQYHPTEHSPQPQGYAPHHHLHNEGSAFHSYQRHLEPVQAYLPQQYPQRYYHVREPQSSHVSPAATLQPAQQPTPQNYTYYAEQAPRSRKPIHIASPAEKPAAAPAVAAVAASGVALAAPMSPPSRRGRSRPLSPRPQANAAKYFPSNSYSPTRGQDRQDMPMSPPSRRMRPRLRSADSVSSLSSEVSSPQLPRAARTASTARTAPTATAAVSSAAVVTAPNGAQVRRDSDAPRGMLVKPIVQVQYKDAQKDESSSGLDDEEMMRIVDKERKSTNLDDALSELEAIYNSLRLGDEDLLDRAERRDLPRGPQYVTYQRTSSLEDDAELSVPTPTSPKLERVGKVRGVPDKVADDMAYRRLRQAERPPSQQDSRSIVSQAGSYLLVSTALSAPQSPLSPRAATLSPEPEPDVTLDDVVYRNVRQANSTLRVAEHQPPFGIPLGPVAPSPNSDYLHATPQDRYRPRFKPRRTPDVVKDDLAFRSLRKDGQRDSAGLPPNPADAVPLHPAVATPPPSEAPTASRKKRAVRSLSANIFSLIQREVDMLDTPLHAPEPRPPGTEKQDFEKAQSVSDLAAVLQVAQKVQARKAAQLKQRTDGADNDATPRASSCYGDAAATSTETLTDSVLDLQPRPRPSPRGGLSGASSDREESSSPSKSMSVDSNLDSLLDEMAKEARETSAKLGREIEELGAAAPSGGRGRAPKARKRSTKAGSPTTADSPTAVKLSHEEKNRQLKEQVVALARCRSGCVDRDREAARSPTTDSDRAQDHARILELSETARTQMESLQQLTEMLSPKPSRRNVTEAPSATRTSASPSRRNVLGEASVARTSPSPTRRAVSPTDPPSSREPSAPQLSPSPSRCPASHSSREPSATKLSPSPARRTVVDSQSSREPSTSRLSPSPRPRRTLSSDGPSSVESGDGDDDLLPVSARVQMWNQRHHSKITSKPPPANKVFVRHADDASTARGSTTSSPQLSDAVDSVDGPTSSAANSLERPRAAASVEAEVDDAVPWRRRRPSLPSPSLTPSLTSPPATPRTPPRPEAAPRAMRSPVHNAVAVVEPAVERMQAVQTAAAAGSSVSNAVDNTVDDAVVRSAGSAVASSVDIAADCPKAPSESSDSSDRDEDDKEVAALLSNTRIPSAAGTAAAPPAAAPTLATAAAPGLPLHRGAAPAAVRPAGEGLACRSRSTSPAPWYRTTESVLIACSYGLACAAKLADADFITALGILLACLTLVAFLLIS